MRIKEALTENDRQFKCCFCCHVRVGTTILGALHVFLNLMLLTCLSLSPIFVASNTDLLKDDLQTGITFTVNRNDTDWDSYYPLDKLNRDGFLVFGFVSVTFIISSMMVYGAVAGRPCCLVPFFCLQILDFCMNTLTLVSYMTYAPNIKLWIIEQGLAENPMFGRLITMDEQWLQILCLIFIILILAVKVYLINMVWTCYKYLQLRVINRNVVREYTTDPDSEMLLPPKYEDAIKIEMSRVPPPPYSA